MTTKRRLLALAVLMAAALLGLEACRRPATAPPHRLVIRIVSSPLADQFDNLPLADQLAHEYARLLPDIEMRSVHTAGGQALFTNEADLSFMTADSAYSANARLSQLGAPGTVELRAIATLQAALLHLLVRRDSNIHTIADLRGRTVGMAEPDSIAEQVLKAFQLDRAIMRKGPLTRTQLASGLLNGEFDAVLVRNLYPATFIQNAISGGAELLSLDGSELDALPFEYPFLQRISLPPGVYIGQTERVRTIAIDVVLACRSNLDETVVYQLTKSLFSAIGHVQAYHPSLRLIAMHGASTTSIPLHEGAARYYREWELFR